MALSDDQTARVIELAGNLAREGETAQLLEFVDHGLPADTQNDAGDSLVMLAAYHGHAETVAALVARGADVDLRNARDQSPVAGAMFKGERDVVRVLLEAGADLDAGTPPARQAAAMFGYELDG